MRLTLLIAIPGGGCDRRSRLGHSHYRIPNNTVALYVSEGRVLETIAVCSGNVVML